VLIQAAFAFIGTEITAIAAAETANVRVFLDFLLLLTILPY
jgi:amino acid permease